MTITSTILIILSIVSFAVLYILDKFMFKKEVSLKQINICIGKSFIFSIAGSIILFLLFDYFHKRNSYYLIPLIISILYLVIIFIQCGTKAKLKNSLFAFTFVISSAILFVNFKSNTMYNNKFLFNIMKDNNMHQNESHTIIHNKYIASLMNIGNESEEVTLRVLHDDIKVIEPKGVIKIKPKQKTKFNIVLESKIKNRKEEYILLEISSGATKKTRKILFTYK